MVVGPAVQFGVSGEAGGAERLLARGALQALLVPGRLVHPQEEAVCDDPRAALTHGVRGAVSAWKRGGPENRQNPEEQSEPALEYDGRMLRAPSSSRREAS